MAFIITDNYCTYNEYSNTCLWPSSTRSPICSTKWFDVKPLCYYMLTQNNYNCMKPWHVCLLSHRITLISYKNHKKH